jgi:hypothetical protein
MEFFQKARDAENCKKKDDFFRMISEIKGSNFGLKLRKKKLY